VKLILIAVLLSFGASVIFVMFTIDPLATAGTLATCFVAIIIERKIGL
jgi:hypothetical protein